MRIARALVSVHDVTPATLPLVTQILSRLQQWGIEHATLLVVPGLPWTETDISRIRRLVAQGHELAGHGWLHRCTDIDGFRHRIHSAVLSRDAAEHLSMGAAQALETMHNCFRWFQDADLDPPDIYVPPAWALGAVSRADLGRQPFRCVEVLSALLDARTGRRLLLPLAGFEADTALRAAVLRSSNTLNRLLAACSGRPLRIAIHPKDPSLMLNRDFAAFCRGVQRAMSYRAFLQERERHAKGRQPVVRTPEE